MDDTIPVSTDTTPARVTSAADPVRLPRLLAFVFPGTTAMYALFNAIGVILLPAQVARLAPDSKVGVLALLTTLAAVASMIALPTGGALSDRTRSRFGRRAPWLMVMACASAPLTIAMGLSNSLVVIAILLTVLWFTMNFYGGAISAILPDRVPVARRGVASAVIGLGTPVGILFGVNLASRVSQVWAYTALALVLLVTTLALVAGAREPSSLDLVTERPKDRGNATAAVRAFFRAFTHRDFALAFASRFGLFLSYFTVSGYLFFTVQDYVGANNVPGGNVAVAVSTLSTVSFGTWIAVATLCGWLADKLDRRKLFIAISALGLGLSQVIPIVSHSWAAMLAYSAVSGASLGTYFAVDLAVMSLVLPDKENEGRDFAILNVATGLPQLAAPAIAGSLIGLGGYGSLFLVSGACALVAGALAMCIRSIR
ncbi:MULTISPECIES: MFS transporter [Streptomyces]|uniref:MFS transporter n=4 Tax=Streptomyces TaxID=1883 RepID=A0AAP6B8L8_9ACTN|nr:MULTISPECIES: MFS transporter [Streptomyces]MBP5860615.1 SLC45 family MFS transporter [Streptomyces sp. LBUM 1484]MBP5870398.1 SLC45 family MFS transporter [Streptomyces sp. LBUM 1485]MBP5909045.1 SLC45 family MFS transporter [Streptomyces sp. LBUM 1478]MBP5928117.1 SLC45 family MFS transporter [Streptomyces sp. LBUM 1479]MBP5936276.1 SLC45 family MFS transporter [Streptomyces sp. LBUM 1476]